MFIADLEIAYLADIAENPSAQGVIDAQINSSIDLSEFRRDFERQYLEYDDLGFDQIKAHNNDEFPISVADDFLEHTHQHIISIPLYDTPNLALSKTIFLIRAVYELLYVDIPNKFDEIIGDSVDENSIKSSIVTYFTTAIDILKSTSETPSWRQVKSSFALDLFDNNLELFISNYVVPVRERLNGGG